jgi:hypothetical protein
MGSFWSVSERRPFLRSRLIDRRHWSSGRCANMGTSVCCGRSANRQDAAPGCPGRPIAARSKWRRLKYLWHQLSYEQKW